MDIMDQFTNKTDFLLSSDTSLIQPTQTVAKPKRKRKTYKCNECNRIRKLLHIDRGICHVCYEYKPAATSGNKVIDNFIKYTQTNYLSGSGKMEFVPYD